MTTFDDGKDDGALRTIGEVGEALGIKAHVLRYWEGQFPTLQPLKRSGGRRYYRPADVALVKEIDRLVNQDGYTLRGAKAALRDFGQPARDARVSQADSLSGQPTPPVPADALTKLRGIRATLAEAIAR